MFALGMSLTGIAAGIAMSRFGRKSLIVVGTASFSLATIIGEA